MKLLLHIVRTEFLFRHLLSELLSLLKLSSSRIDQLYANQQLILSQMSKLATLVPQPPPVHSDEKWLDGQEVRLMLHISKGKLQSLRDQELLPFTKREGKCYYKAVDIQGYLEAHYTGHREPIPELENNPYLS